MTSPLTEEELQTFIRRYTEDDASAFAYDWNGGYGAEAQDANYQFRLVLCDYSCRHLNDCPDAILAALYTALSKGAEHGVGFNYQHYQIIAQELLERDGIKYFDLYMRESMRCMDTGIVSSQLTLSENTIRDILDYINDQLAKTGTPDAKQYESMRQRFEGYLNE